MYMVSLYSVIHTCMLINVIPTPLTNKCNTQAMFFYTMYNNMMNKQQRACDKMPVTAQNTRSKLTCTGTCVHVSDHYHRKR